MDQTITTILDFSRLKNRPLSRGYFGSYGRALVDVAVVERFNWITE